MCHLGLQVADLVAGRLNIRGHAGYVFRWGFGWFWEMRDGGLGWSFGKHDKPAVDLRIKFLLDLFTVRRQPDMLTALVDGVAQLALQDAT